MSARSTSPGCGYRLTRRQALARLGLAAGCMATVNAWGGPSPKPTHQIKGAEQLMRTLEADRLARALPREADSETLSTLRRRYEQLPSQMDYVSTVRSGNTIRLAVEKRGASESDRIIVMVHGLLADRETWMYVVGALGEDHECWLIDLPGCGDSEAPNPKHVEDDAYSPAGMADRILQVIAQCLRDRADRGVQTRELVVAGHSLGGTVCLRMAADPDLRTRHSNTLNQITAMALFAPCDVAVNSEIPCFMTVLGLNKVKVGVGVVLGVVEDKVREITRDAYHVRPCATQEQAERFTEALTKMPKLRAAQAMIRTAVPWNEQDHRPDWPNIKKVEAGYANVDVPCLITWGEWDETLTECMGHKIRDKVPTAKLVEIEGAGHCLPSEVPELCAQLILKAGQLTREQTFDSLAPVTSFGTDPLPGEWPMDLPLQHPSAASVLELAY